jgi:hypothetical protein
MVQIEIKPLEGISITGVGEVLFGQSMLEVTSLLGQPSAHSDATQSFYDNYELRIDFDEQGVSFIEFIYGPYPERIVLSLYGINPFTIGADQLIELLSSQNNGPIDDSEAAYCYAFLNISVGVWREATPKDIQSCIDEAKLDGTPIDQIHQWEEELESVQNFWTVGIGRKGYYEAI